MGTASDAAKSFELLKILARGQPRVAHVVKTHNTRETHVIIRVPAVIVYPLRGTQLATEIWRLTSWILLLGPS